MQEKSRRARRGFTLLELTIAIAVVLVAVLATASTQVSALGLSRSARDTAQATSDLASAMEEVLLFPGGQIPTQFPAGQSVPRFDDLNLEGERIVATYPGWAGAGPLPDPVVVRLTITWTDKSGRARTQFLTCARAR